MNVSAASAIVFILLGGLITALNVWIAIEYRRTGRFRSSIPLLGGLFLCAGLFLYPKTRPYAWVALLLDPGTLSLLRSLPKVAKELWGTSRFNLHREYVGKNGPKLLVLRLFRKEVFTFRADIKRPPDEPGYINAGMIGAWRMENGRMHLQTEDEAAVLERLPDISPETFRLVEGFAAWQARFGISLADCELMLQSPSATSKKY
jgi:hypothetical protein